MVLVHLEGMKLSTREVHRFPNASIRTESGSLRWNWPSIVEEARRGIDRALSQANVTSIGIDAWGVDYGLVEENGKLVSLPFSYRDERTAAWKQVIDRLGGKAIYGITGIQLMPINTLIQLAVHDREEISRARWVLPIPELLICSLTGAICGEHTSASTTQLYDARRREWSKELCASIGVSPDLLPPIKSSGASVGEYANVPVFLVGNHDTASAVAAIPTEQGSASAYLSSGTWSLIGTELKEPELGSKAFELNFSNEAGVYGSIRFLKNVMGLWMLDACLREWGIGLKEALAAAKAEPSAGPTVDATDERFLNPASMESEVRAAASSVGASRGALVRCILDSLAQAYSQVLAELADVTAKPAEVLHVVGGGSHISVLNQLTANACGIPVIAGPSEATAIGNGLVQLIAHGWLADLEEARAAVRSSFQLRRFEP